MLHTNRLNAIPSLINELFGQEENSFPYYKNQTNAKITETEEGFNIYAIVAGIDKKDISIEFDKGILNIKSEIKKDAEEESKEFTHREFKIKPINLSYKVDAAKIDVESISAEQKNGILQVKLLKKENSAPKKLIEIE